MKKMLIFAATILAGFSLAGCGDHHSTSKTTYKINVDLKTNGKHSTDKTKKGSTTSTVKSSTSSKNQSSNNAVSKDSDQDGGDGSGYAGCNYQDDREDVDAASESHDYSYHNDEESSSVWSSSPQASSDADQKRYTDTTNAQAYTYNPSNAVEESQQE